jgi:hypothetical protein
MRIVSWNLRYDSQPGDWEEVKDTLERLPNPLEEPQYLKLTGEQHWNIRRIRIAEYLLREEPVIACALFFSSCFYSERKLFLGFQEALKRQVDDLVELLGEGWSWVSSSDS